MINLHKIVAPTRTAICSALEDLGGVNTRLREIEDNQARADTEEDILEWLTTASETLAQAVLDIKIITSPIRKEKA